jgi:UDP-glucose/GDP-mannose dehydrogenase family, NAD binding domain
MVFCCTICGFNVIRFKMKQKFSLFTPPQNNYNEIKNIGFLGLGRIGLPQSLVFANKGLKVFGFDVNPLVVRGLIEKQTPFDEPSMAHYLDSNLNKTFFPNVLTEDSYTKLSQLDAIIFTLGTPAPTDQTCLENKKPDLSAHYSIIDGLFTNNFKNGLVLIFRTTFPLGATNEIKKYIESKYSLIEGDDFHLIFVPERLMEGRAILEEEMGVTTIDVYDPNLKRNQYTQIPQYIAPAIERSTNELSPEFFAESQAIIVCHRHRKLIELAENNELSNLLAQVNKNCYIFDGWSIWTKANFIKGICYEGLGYPTQVNPTLTKEDGLTIMRSKL